MKILNLIQCANLGGMEQASLRLMRALQDRGHELELLSLNPIGGLGPLLKESGIPHAGLPYGGYGGWRILPALRRKLAESHADAFIMTGHHLLAMITLGNVAKGRRILAIHFHHTGVKPDWQWRLIYRIACKKFQAITFPADFIRREAERIYPPVARLARTVRYPLFAPPVPTAEQKLAAREAIGLPGAGPIVGNAGWLIRRKRFDVFLHTAAAIADRRPDVRFVIAGDGEERRKLESLAARLHLAHRVTWTGWLKNMDVFFNSLDVLLFNSDWDALPVTPQQAMVYAVPVVASVEHGGLKEIICKTQYGYLLPRHDPKALAQAAVDLLQHPEAARQTGLAGREHMRMVGDPEAIATEHEKLWQAGNFSCV